MERIVTYNDWQMDYDPQTGKYYATDEDGVYECKLVGLSNEKEHTDEELLLGDFVGKQFNYGGEFDIPLEEDLGIIDGVHKYDYTYQYGYWEIVKEIKTFEEEEQYGKI